MNSNSLKSKLRCPKCHSSVKIIPDNQMHFCECGECYSDTDRDGNYTRFGGPEEFIKSLQSEDDTNA